jgi:hypothetical protein
VPAALAPCIAQLFSGLQLQKGPLLFRDNVVRPLTNVRDEFFETFSSRASYSKSGKADFEASKASLERMLEQFEADIALKDKGFVDGKKATSRMDLLLRHYERELRHPLRNAVTGHLPRALLVQVQCLCFFIDCCWERYCGVCECSRACDPTIDPTESVNWFEGSPGYDSKIIMTRSTCDPVSIIGWPNSPALVNVYTCATPRSMDLFFL